jgi:hypothetical protein
VPVLSSVHLNEGGRGAHSSWSTHTSRHGRTSIACMRCRPTRGCRRVADRKAKRTGIGQMPERDRGGRRQRSPTVLSFAAKTITAARTQQDAGHINAFARIRLTILRTMSHRLWALGSACLRAVYGVFRVENERDHSFPRRATRHSTRKERCVNTPKLLSHGRTSPHRPERSAEKQARARSFAIGRRLRG